MAKIRVHELAKELERENKDIIAALQKIGVEAKSHMSNVEEEEASKIRSLFARGKAVSGEAAPASQKSGSDLPGRVEQKPETGVGQKADAEAVKKPAAAGEKQPTAEGAAAAAEKKPGAGESAAAGERRPAAEAGAAVPPKKKNIIQVFRPQNSKTGMVKPGSRPRPQGQSGMRPQGQPGMRPQGQPGMRPQGQPGMRPQGQPGAGAQGRPAAGAQGRPIAGAQGRPAAGAQGRPVAGAQGRPAAGAQGRPAAGTQGRPASGTQGRPAAGAQGQPIAGTQGRPAAGAQGQPIAGAQSRPAAGAQGRPAAGAQGQPIAGTQGRPVAGAQGQPIAGTQGRPAAGVQGRPAAGAQGQPIAGTQGRPAAGAQGRPIAGAQGRPTAGQQGEVRAQDAQVRQTAASGVRAQGQSGARPQGQPMQRTQGQSGDRSQAGTRPQGSRYQGDGQGRSQGGRFGGDGQGRGQGGRFGGDGQGRGQGGRFGGDGQSRGQGGRFGGDGQSRSQGGRFGGDGQGRSQGGRSSGIPKPQADSKPIEKESRKRTERGDRNRNDKGDKLDRLEKNARQNQKGGVKKGQQVKAPVQKPAEKPEEVIRNITIPEKLTISELAEAMKVQPSVIVKKLFLQGTMVTVNQEIDFDTAEEIALEFNCICEKEVKVNVIEELLKEEEDPEETLVPRSPVVCVMGHVDHGKTSLLDAIRNTHVIDKEAGGITQHIGAYVVSINGQRITFLDTPGHEAFTAMRMRGANATDIAILVVAADDGVMPQTIEAISHAKAAGVDIIVAVNKIDKPSANVERVKQELSEYDLVPEDWGGSTVFVPVSAHTHEGIDMLLEMILLTAEVAELRANPKRKARGLVIEAELDKGKGPVATVLVQKGTLHVGDPVAAGSCYGKVRAMMDDKGRRVKEAGPSTPVEILGFSDVPNAGEIFMSMDNEKEARSFAETFISEGRERLLEDTKSRMSLDDLFSQIQAGNLKELDIIVKADVQGSVEAVKQSLLKLSNEEVIVKIIHGGVGAINESDVILASASNALIIGFNVRPDAMAKATAEREGVDIRLYRVIYDAIADVEAAMKGMLDPIFEEKVIGHAEIRQIFKASGVGTIGGSYVTDGIFQRNCLIRISREGKMIYEGSLASLKRFKDDVKEVRAGYECGLVFEKFNDLQEEDKVEAYIMVEVPR